MIRCLTELFSSGGLLAREDGITVNRKRIFCMREDSPKDALRLFVNLCARLGVEIGAFSVPLTGEAGEDALSLRLDESVPRGKCILRLQEGGAVLCAADVSSLEAGVKYLTVCYPSDGLGSDLRRLDLENGGGTVEEVVIDAGGLFVEQLALSQKGGRKIVSPERKNTGSSWGNRKSYDAAKQHFEQNLDVRIVVNQDAEAVPEAVLRTALRLAAENFETVWPYGLTAPAENYRNVAFKPDGSSDRVERTKDGLLFRGSGEGVLKLADAYAAEETDPLNASILTEAEEIFSARNEVGQALSAVLGCRDRKREKVLVTKEYAVGFVDRKRLEEFVSGKIGATKIRNFNDGKEIMHRIYRDAWEGDAFMKVFREKVLPQVQPGDAVKLSGLLSEDRDVRRSLEQEIRAELEQKGASAAQVEILCAFKSGYSWIEERVLPALQSRGCSRAVEKVRIYFPYLLNERRDDRFEDESAPNYGRHMDDPLKYFDIPTRWLQELFPVDELIAEQLGIDRTRVEFVREDALPCTYRFAAFDGEDRLLYDDDFSVKYVEKNYIEKYPQIGKTHVTSGCLRAEINGEKRADLRIETDPEKVWRIMESEIIPNLEHYLVGRYGLDGLVDAQPLFNRLQINIYMSELDRDLGFRQERISTVEAMQEDMYFYLLDWFKTFGERECGRELDNVGLIMPEPEISKGKQTKVEVILYEDFAAGAELREGETTAAIEETPVSLSAESVSFSNGTMRITAKSDPVTVKKAQLLNEMIESGVVDFYSPRDTELRLICGDETADVRFSRTEKRGSSLTEAEKNRILGEEVVDYEQYLELLRYYNDAAEADVRIAPAETTYKGRKIFLIECVRRRAGLFYSRNKLRSERISAAFTARHHGNEASSLNSTFLLLERLLTDRRALLDRVNFVLVPFINIDGGMLHCRIQRKHPKWLCHPARYNSVGFEFRKDFGKEKSKYGEARLLGKIWKEYLFDVITDNHGFEGHELCQPFSGYISPWYKSFWIPRALYYGYIWYKGDRRHMVEIGSEIRSRVAAAINGDEEIRGLNIEFADRFYKYAQKWFPDLFTLDKYEDVVFYWTDTDEKPRAANYGVCNPEITAIDWTTEVADETAVGEYMGTNVRAHHLSDLAVLDILESCPLLFDESVSPQDGELCYARFRRRPLYAE